MPLDLLNLGPQIERYVPRYLDDARAQAEGAARLRAALAELGDRWTTVDDRRAGFMEDPQTVYAAPPPPASYRVLATDGSQIAVDRHQVASCYVINVGTVRIEYGERPDAELASVPQLLPDHGMLSDDDNGDADVTPPSRQTSLELERAAAEVRTLRRLVEAAPADLFTLALVDNSLVLWSQTMNAEAAADHQIVSDYIAELEAFAELARTRPLALAGYLSNPGSPWVADLVAAAAGIEAPSGTNGPLLLDRDLFHDLGPGERSARFKRVAPMLALPSFPSECWVDFCYLHAGGETARVEIPRWVSRDADLLALTHATLLDQCRRNAGNPAYPVALMEAHEQAVVSDADRRAFWTLLTQRLEASGVDGSASAKARTKRTPWT